MMDAATFKDLADRFGAVLAARMRQGAGTGTTHGLTGKLTEGELERFAFPMQVVAQQLTGDIDDYLVLISDMELGTLEECLAGCGTCVGQDLSSQVELGELTTFTFDDMPSIMDELAALYNERTLRFNTPQGDIVMVLGDALLTAAQRANLPYPEQRIEIGVDEATAEDAAPQDANGTIPSRASSPAGTSTDAPASPDHHATPEIQAHAEPPGAQAHVWSRLLTGVEVTVSAELGSTHMSLGDATGLAAESIVTLDQTAEDPMTIYVNGTPFATARLVVVDEHYGIEIIEIIDPSFATRAETWIAA